MDKKTKSIFIVEEQALVASNISRIIQKSGFKLGGVALKIDKARKIIADEKPNLGLVVIDADLDGSFDFGAEMNKAGAGVLYLATSAVHIDKMVHPLSQGYVKKPIPDSLLMERIEDFYKTN